MAVIFLLSAQPDLSSGLGNWDLVGRKFVHAGSYALLTLLWIRALVPHIGRRALVAAAVISFLFAISDEYHQTFVEGRHGSPVDVGIDSVGIVVAVLVARTGRFGWIRGRDPAGRR